MIVLDSSILVDHLRGDERAHAALLSAIADRERLVASVLTRVEILAGMRPTEETATRQLLGSLEWIGVDEELAEHAGLLASRYLRSHPGVDPVDFVIAATTERLNATLWTLNLKHFPMFPDIAAPY